jgi:uncharacterized membrane protein YkoI
MNVRTLPGRKAIATLSLVACGLVGGATLATVGTASAADAASTTTSTSTAATSSTATATKVAETPLTGDTLAKVKAAVSAKYPGATFTRVETDSDGVYEAHIVTAAGTKVTVEVDKAYAVTGTEASAGKGGHGGKGGGSGETALTGDTLAKVKAAVSAKYPGATFTRVETDSDGVYEAHIVTAAGDKVTVELDKAYAVTGTE